MTCSLLKEKIKASKLTGKKDETPNRPPWSILPRSRSVVTDRWWMYLWKMGEARKTTCSCCPSWNQELWILSQERNKTLILSMFYQKVLEKQNVGLREEHVRITAVNVRSQIWRHSDPSCPRNIHTRERGEMPVTAASYHPPCLTGRLFWK